MRSAYQGKFLLVDHGVAGFGRANAAARQRLEPARSHSASNRGKTTQHRVFGLLLFDAMEIHVFVCSGSIL